MRRMLVGTSAFLYAIAMSGGAHAATGDVNTPPFLEVRGTALTAISNLGAGPFAGGGLDNFGWGGGLEVDYGGGMIPILSLILTRPYLAIRGQQVYDRYEGFPSTLGAAYLEAGETPLAVETGAFRFETNTGIGLGMRWAGWDAPIPQTKREATFASDTTQHVTESAFSLEAILRATMIVRLNAHASVLLGVGAAYDIWTLGTLTGQSVTGPFPQQVLWPRVEIGYRWTLGAAGIGGLRGRR